MEEESGRRVDRKIRLLLIPLLLSMPIHFTHFLQLPLFLLLLLLRVKLALEKRVAFVQRVQVADDGQATVHNRILRVHHGLVEVVRVGDVCGSQAALEHERRVWSDEERNGAGAAGWPRATLGVERYVAHDDGRVASVPVARLDPVDGVEERRRAAEASVDVVDALDVRVAGALEQLHQARLDALGLVDERLGADVEAADLVRAHAPLVHEVVEHGEAHGVDVLVVESEAHLRLPEADRVLARRDGVERLQLRLAHVLGRIVDIHGQYANISRIAAVVVS